MDAGRSLDALIAEKIFGWRLMDAESGFAPGEPSPFDEGVSFADYERLRRSGTEIPHYSTSISDAWAVVEKLRELKFDIHVWSVSGFDWDIEIFPNGEPHNVFTESGPFPHAICLAALAAMEGK